MWHETNGPCYTLATMSLAVATGCVFGLAAGMRHALEPDHLAAVSTFVASPSKDRAVVRYAAAWGAGHALMLVVVGAILFALGRRMPERLADTFELGVAIMLVLLGARGLRRGRKADAHGHSHAPKSPGALPFLVGVAHGLAGSGALAGAVALSQPSPALGVLTLALYGVGASLGMVALAYVVALVLKRTPLSGERLMRGLALGTSAVSLLVGIAWAAPILQRLAAA